MKDQEKRRSSTLKIHSVSRVSERVVFGNLPIVKVAIDKTTKVVAKY